MNITIEAAATIVTAIIALGGFILTLRSLNQSERSLRFGVYHQVLDMMERTRTARHLLQDKVPKDSTATSLSHLTEDERKQVDELARTYDKLGLLVKHGAVPLEFVNDFYSRPIVIAWHRLELYIREERAKRPQSGHMVKFEMLAVLAKQHRDKFHASSNEETFAMPRTPPEPMKEWHIWHK